MDAFRLLLPAQLLLLAGTLATLAFWPPAEGRLLLVPLDGARPGVLLTAVTAGAAAQLVGQGPGGTLVLEGSRARVSTALAGHRVLLMAAPRSACGDRA